MPNLQEPWFEELCQIAFQHESKFQETHVRSPIFFQILKRGLVHFPILLQLRHGVPPKVLHPQRLLEGRREMEAGPAQAMVKGLGHVLGENMSFHVATDPCSTAMRRDQGRAGVLVSRGRAMTVLLPMRGARGGGRRCNYSGARSCA